MNARSEACSLLTEKQVAEILAIEPATLRRWRWSGSGPRFRKIGSAVRYHPEDVTAFIDKAARNSTSGKLEDA